MYEIRQATVADWPLIESFINDCYGAGAYYKREARWSWQFVNTPYKNQEASVVPVWIALHNGNVIGQMALQPAQMRIEGTLEPAGWIVDVMIRHGYRGIGLGHRIHDAIKATGQTLFTLTMAEATRRIAVRADCLTLGPVHQMVRVHRLSTKTVAALIAKRTGSRRHWRKAGRVFNRSWIGPAMVAAILSGAAGLHRWTRRRRKYDTGGSVYDCANFNAESVDALACACAAKIPALFDRSAAFCNWRFNSIPDLIYHRAEYKRDGKVAGLAVWRLPEPIELPVGTLTDIMADPKDHSALAALIEHAVFAMESKCEAIIAGASHPAHIAALSQSGFVTVKIHHPTVVTIDVATREKIERVKDQWHFTKADHDWDQIHPPYS